jgi:hypothetical protein
MNMLRYVFFVFAIILGLTLGVFYGREVNPVELVDASPDTLRIDYQADYVLMVAEVYDSEKDAALAVRQLALLGSTPPEELINEVLSFALENGYHPEDLVLMRDLGDALSTWEPGLEGGSDE